MDDSANTVSSEAFGRLLRLLRYLRQHRHQMKDQGISPRDYSVLRFLHESGSATVGEVQAYLHSSPSTASTLIAQLDAAGYVTRTRSNVDNRVVIVDLTPEGREVALRTPLAGLPLLRRQLGTLPKEQLLLVNEALGEILQLLEVTGNE
jgi:DNA-binding MarR family transcriptional regulator